MNKTSWHCPESSRHARPLCPSDAAARGGSLSGRLATLAGAAGAVAVGAGEAKAVPYTPTAGVVAAQGISGFSFDTSTNTATLGSLRPPASDGTIGWDVDGSGGNNFTLRNTSSSSATLLGSPGVGSLRGNGGSLFRQLTGFTISQSLTWNAGRIPMTANGANLQNNFNPSGAGQFGFRFTQASSTYYGWGSLVIDGTAHGQGFKITEAYYQSTPGGAISVGAVPVPEPSGMALLGLGAAGVAAWRARREKHVATKSEPEA